MILNHLMSLSLTTLLYALLLRTTLIMALNFYEIMGCTKEVRHAIQCRLIGCNILNHECMYFYYDVLKVESLFCSFYGNGLQYANIIKCSSKLIYQINSLNATLLD